MKKSFSGVRDACIVTFRLSQTAAGKAGRVSLVGDFNEWDADATPLVLQKDGSFAAALELPTGRKYRFRYLVDSSRWENDWDADRHEPSGYPGTENSVVEL